MNYCHRNDDESLIKNKTKKNMFESKKSKLMIVMILR